MYISVFDLFTIGIGPSSSHSVGPMRAANRFINHLIADELLTKTKKVTVEIYGSLAWTGKGHNTDIALLMGLENQQPETIDTDCIAEHVNRIKTQQKLKLAEQIEIMFNPDEDIIYNRTEQLPLHPNGIKFTAYDVDNTKILVRKYYSIGGGFVLNEEQADANLLTPAVAEPPYPFSSADELMKISEETKLPICDIIFKNELTYRKEEEIKSGLRRIWEVMQACVEKGLNTPGILPGVLKVKRRAPALYESLLQKAEKPDADPLRTLDWVNLFALAVNEENAAGGRVVTAPTNGAAGIIPAVLHYYHKFCPNANEQGTFEFLLTAGAIASLYKQNASISGAEVGCQGEVGVACSMAGGALAHVLGGSTRHVEQAAEIGMEHNLGLTCDPVGGLVQVPCIERNAMGSVKAINAARLALQGDGEHRVSLDRVIKTMRETGRDMQTKYKETSLGGLAVNVSEC